jgi:hypothetical protein
VRYRVRWPALLALLAALCVPATASATVTPSLTLTPSSLPAGSTHALDLKVMFSPSLGDSPTNLNLSLPAGLILNANLASGACVSAATPTTGCELATGTATTTFLTPELVSLWLVKGPSPLDIAGAALVAGLDPSGQVQTTADVTLRTTPDLGLNLSFTTLPGGINALNTIDLSLTSVRAPTSCPSPPATVGVSAISSEVGSAQTATAPLTVTGCGSLSYAPKLTGTIERDTGDSGAAFAATVTNSASAAATKALELDLPASIAPNPNAALVCLLGTPCVIGTASASSPLLPSSALSHGIVNLGGSLLAPTLTVGFPPPYPVAFMGTVDTSTEALTFNQIPDLPLTSLTVQVGGGSSVKLFTTSCAPGSLAVKLTPWNGAAPLPASAPITFGGSCPASPNGPSTPTAASGAPTVSAASLRGLVRRAAKLAFTVQQGRSAAPITRIALTLPKGLAPASARRTLTHGITVRNAHGKTARFVATARRGVLTITLSGVRASARILITAPTLTVSASLAHRVQAELRHKKVVPVRFGLKLTDSARKTTGLALRLKPKS